MSPDGTKILFDDANARIGVLGIDGTGLRYFDLRLGADMPEWSPDGSRIAFQGTNAKGNGDIYVMNSDGSNIRRLTTNRYVDEWPTWSPDGSTIVYDNVGITALDSDGFSPTSEIYSVPAAGGTPTRLTHN